MKMLAALAGTILCAVGSFSFAFYANAFSEIAFVVGTSFMAAGGFCCLSYLVSGHANRLPESVLVEGLMDIVIGFIVNMDYVADNQLTTLFGLWTLVCGVTRVTQSFVVSRHNPRKWFAVLPLGLIGAIYGAVMLMPILSLNYSALFQSSIGFIVTGLSLIVYTMYMASSNLSAKGEKAKERAEAKRMLAEERKAKRKALKELSSEEREMLLRREEEARRAVEEAKKILKSKNKEKNKTAASVNVNKIIADANTVQLSPAEVEQINSVSKEDASFGSSETSVTEVIAPETVSSKTEDSEIIQKESPLGSPSSTKEAEAPLPSAEQISFEQRVELEDLILSAADSKTADIANEDLKKAAEIIVNNAEAATKANFVRPENIPSLRKNLIKEEAEEVKTEAPVFDSLNLKAKRSIVNLEELENFRPEEAVKLGEVELPKVAINAEGGEAEQRGAFLLEIDKTEADEDEETANFKPLTLEELFADKDFDIKPIDRKDMTQTDLHLTQTFNFDWSILDKKK